MCVLGLDGVGGLDFVVLGVVVVVGEGYDDNFVEVGN